MYSEARDLALEHGCTILQAVREWYTAKGGSSNSELLGKAIQEISGRKRTRSPAYIDKLNADMRLVQSHFGADRPIDRIRSKESRIPGFEKSNRPGGAIICDRK